ncbi:MAG TPA: glycine dehydrogenase (aminomethyl-transferring), partial [Gemmatimonadaceae bacterium]|nr:glycine dehydrogenase (aminomethyl-transferring) [Gemmatimonadaceae bacterium]
MSTKQSTKTAERHMDAGSFIPRHIGPSQAEQQEMLQALGFESLDAMIDATVPESIRLRRPLAIHGGLSEYEALGALRRISKQNEVSRSYLGLGYHACITPPVIQRNVLENPGWYTAYTPYQAEIAQGRLEALLNFQTMVMDLTGFEIANASLLDEGTSAAEAMAMAYAARGKDKKEVFFVADSCHPQTIDVVRTRARARGIEIVVGDFRSYEFTNDVFGALIQYPTTDGAIHDYRDFCEKAHAANAVVVAAADLMSLVLLAPPGEWGADVCVGSTQRFGVPMGFGGPHAAFFATRDEFKRLLPGRIIGVSRDADGKPALRMALQTREQHIRREKATSNVCTAQVLLAVIASMYAVWHGPKGLHWIARRIHRHAAILAAGLEKMDYQLSHSDFFDTIRVDCSSNADDAAGAEGIVNAARERGINLRKLGGDVVVALDETVNFDDLRDLLEIFALGADVPKPAELAADVDDRYDERFARTSAYLTHP